MILRTIAELYIEKGKGLVYRSELSSDPRIQGVSQEDMLESLVILEQQGYIEPDHALGPDGRFSTFQLTNSGFTQYAHVYIPDYENLVKQIAGLIVNEDIKEGTELAKRIEKPMMLIYLVLKQLEEKRHLRLNTSISFSFRVIEISPSLKRIIL